jgi:hypothetical protein
MSQDKLRSRASAASFLVHQVPLRRLFEVHPTLQVNKSGVRMKAVEPGIDLEKGHPISTILKGFFQPLKGLILVFQPNINSCDVIGRKVLLLREFDQTLQFVLRFLRITG